MRILLHAGLALVLLACSGSGDGPADGAPPGDGARPDAGDGGMDAGRDTGTGPTCGSVTCGPGSFCCGPPACGFCAPNESGVFCPPECPDAGPADTGPADTGPADTGPEPADAAPVACEPDAGDCGDTACECCGSAGPRPICLCTTRCTGDGDCTDAARPHCNLDPFGGGDGVCTTAAFECCWGCD